MNGKFDSDKFYERLYLFGLNSAQLTKEIPRSELFREYKDQLIWSSGSVGANYIEALEALSKKDFAHRLKISRKEVREIKKILTSSIITLETR